jgi:hypothetical protein
MAILDSSNFRSDLSFPTIKVLPEELDPDTIYTNAFDDVMRHWCLFGEIVEIIPWPVRLSLIAKDKDGTQYQVAFYDDLRGGSFASLCKPGRTVAVLYPKKHYFADGQRGLRVESEVVDAGRVKVFPFALETLLKANDKIFEAKEKTGSCGACGKEVKLMNCGRCGVVGYCGKVSAVCLIGFASSKSNPPLVIGMPGGRLEGWA